MRYVIVSALLLTTAACQQPATKTETPAAVDTTAAVADIQKAEEAQIAAIAAKDLTQSTGVYSADAVFIDEKGNLVTGSDAISNNFKQFLSDPSMKLDYQPGSKVFSDDGTMAYSTATFTESYTDPATKKIVTLKGTNLSVWKRQADGSWKLVADSNPASPAS